MTVLYYHFRLFLAMGIPFGIIMGVFHSFQFGARLGLEAGVVKGIFFGGFMSLILGFGHRRAVKRMSSGTSEETMGVHHVRRVELRLPYDKAFDLCIESLSRIKKCTIQKEDRPQGIILAKVAMTWKAWGDVISFNVCKGNDGVHVEVSSRPCLRWTLVDWGKNLENVETLVGFLNAHSEV